MNIFGGTATFSLISSIISTSRSALVVGLLCTLGNVAYHMTDQSTQNVLFSAFVAVLISSAFVMSRYLTFLVKSFRQSRWSSNPMFLQIFFRLLPWWKHTGCCTYVSSENNDSEGSKQTEPRVSYKKNKLPEAASSIVLELGTARKEPKPKKNGTKKNESAQNMGGDMMGNVEDPLPQILQNTLSLRVQHDFFYVIINTLLLFALHSTSVFIVAQPHFEVC